MPRSSGRRIDENALFKVGSRKRLAETLLVNISFIQTAHKRANQYRRVWKPKKSDGPWLKTAPSINEAKLYRPIDLAAPELKRVQTRIAKLLSVIAVPDFIFSPAKGRSYVDNAAAHRDSAAFWMLDIDSYFPSCRQDRVAWFFRVKMNCAPDVAEILAQLACHEGSLPQGSPCSPILSYFSNMEMWEQVAKLAKEADCRLSVYADDITLSGEMVPKELIWSITEILFNHGFKLNDKKGHSRINQAADITGVIVYRGELKIANRQLLKLYDLKKARSVTPSSKRRTLENRIGGTKAQHRQISSRTT